jgi:hypothetical protein
VLFDKDKTTLIAYRSKEKNYIIPNSVTSIGFGAFYGCNSLTSINIPNSVTNIGDRAFSLCDSLTNINIPNSVVLSLSNNTWCSYIKAFDSLCKSPYQQENGAYKGGQPC